MFNKLYKTCHSQSLRLAACLQNQLEMFNKLYKTCHSQSLRLAACLQNQLEMFNKLYKTCHSQSLRLAACLQTQRKNHKLKLVRVKNVNMAACLSDMLMLLQCFLGCSQIWQRSVQYLFTRSYLIEGRV